MKSIFLILCASVTITACINAQPAYNLDLEHINKATGFPEGWGLDNVKGTDIPTGIVLNAFKVDSTVKQHGAYSLLIDWTDPPKEWTASNYVIKEVFKGQTITLTGYIKTEEVTKGAGLWMRIDGKDGMLQFDNMHDRAVKGTTDWQQYKIELYYDQEKAKQIVVGGLIMGGKGKVWMDNLQVKIDGKDISEATVYARTLSKSELDSAFNNGSGIASISLSGDRVKTLANLGMLWGFIKYHHTNVNKGNFNMDAELFRVLPEVLGAETTEKANAVMEKWVDGFGTPEACRNCSDFEKTEKTKLVPDYGYLFAADNFPKTLTDKLEYIKHNRGSKENHYVKMTQYVRNPEFQHEESYSKIVYPDVGMRLLALYRFWNMVQYFFPDRHLIGGDWNRVLGEFVPEFCNAKDTLAYQLACLKLIARINDTHATIRGGGTKIEEMKGKYITPFKASFIEDKLVVVDFYKDTLDTKDRIKRGDIIEKIDGVAVDELVKKYLPLTAASNYETQLRELPSMRGFLLRSNNQHARIAINRDGKSTEVDIVRVRLDSAMRSLDLGIKTETGYKMLEDSIAYLFPAKLKDGDIDIVEKQFAHAKGLVIDMRCYPSTFMTFNYANWLKPESSPFVKFTAGSLEHPGSFSFTADLSNGKRNKDNFKGKTVIIVNAITQSSAEYQTMALCTTPGCKVIGSTTAGADGNVSTIMLPGGIKTMFSGIGIIYPDGTESQRTGVKIDKVMKPTIKGIAEGRDELLEEAIRMIKG